MSRHDTPPRLLIDSASDFYRPAGRFAWHFARGKLGADPAYRAILEQGLLRDCTRVLDLGAGQGLLAAWLLAAHSCHASARGWPAHWPAPPQLQEYTGIEINAAEVRRARRAFARDGGARVQMLHADMRAADFVSSDAAILLDVLHYSDFPAQEHILARVRTALMPRGRVLVRIGDAGGGLGFTVSKAVDRAVVLMRLGRWRALHTRTLSQWHALLERVGFRVRSMPMSSGTPFTNVLLLGELA